MADTKFGIYIHWPFCLHLCPYCDFNSYLFNNYDENGWVQAYSRAIDYWEDYQKGDMLTSIYFGGGTPSTASPAVISKIIEKISSHWNINDAEITLEANPTSVEAEKFKAFRKAGVNRLSIGFQAFNDASLKALGRMHSVAESLKALEIARDNFNRTNFDVIYARQHQTVSDWENELKQLVRLNPSHVSLYQLTIEPNTVFGKIYDQGKLQGLPSSDRATEMFELTRDFMRDEGFNHYEVSNFAKKGDQSRHNLIYWNYHDYIGIGPGAHGRISLPHRTATIQPMTPKDWLRHPEDFKEDKLSDEQQVMEYILMAMRLEKGIQFERLDRFGYRLPEKNVAELKSLELVVQDNLRLRATDKGRLVLNHIIEKLTT